MTRESLQSLKSRRCAPISDNAPFHAWWIRLELKLRTRGRAAQAGSQPQISRKLSHPVGSLPFFLSPSALHPRLQPVIKFMRAVSRSVSSRLWRTRTWRTTRCIPRHSPAPNCVVQRVPCPPAHPRTPQVASDRGRYPEEACGDGPQHESTPSVGKELEDLVPFVFGDSTAAATRPATLAQSVNGDELSMLESSIGAHAPW